MKLTAKLAAAVSVALALTAASVAQADSRHERDDRWSQPGAHDGRDNRGPTPRFDSQRGQEPRGPRGEDRREDRGSNDVGRGNPRPPDGRFDGRPDGRGDGRPDGRGDGRPDGRGDSRDGRDWRGDSRDGRDGRDDRRWNDSRGRDDHGRWDGPRGRSDWRGGGWDDRRHARDWRDHDRDRRGYGAYGGYRSYGGSYWHAHRGVYVRPYGYAARHWYRGERLPSWYCDSRYVIHDHYAYRLHEPPRGYRWVRVDGDAILAAIATGIVLEVVYDYFG